MRGLHAADPQCAICTHPEGLRLVAAHEFGEHAPAAYPNPEDEHGQWFHGTSYDPKQGDLKTPDERGEDVDGGYRHWNTHLGTHFTSVHATAKMFAKKMSYSPGHDPAYGRIAHASLHMESPVHYKSEHAMTRDAFHWARKHGFNDYDRGEEYDEEPEDRHWLNKSMAKSGDHDDWIRGHPRVSELAHGFKKHLQGQGFDGITYGNEHEKPIGHTSAIAFKETPVKINHWEKLHEPQQKVAMGMEGPDYDKLRFKKVVDNDEEGDPEAARANGDFAIHAIHPEHGVVGKLTYADMEHPEWTGYPERALHINMIRVHQDHRRRGVATQLMKHLEETHPDVPIDHGTRTRMGEAWGRHMYGRESKPSTNFMHGMGWDDEANKETPTHYEADWTLNGKPWNIKTKKPLRRNIKRASINVPHSRAELINHAEGTQTLYKPHGQQMYGPGVCAAHALQLEKERQTKFKDFGVEGMDEDKPEHRWMSVGNGSCGTCTRHQNEAINRLPGGPSAPLDGPHPSPESRPRGLAPRHEPFDPSKFHGLAPSTSATKMVRPSEVWDHIRTDVHPHRLDTIRDSVAEHGWQPDWNVADGPIKVSLDPPTVSNGSHRLHVLRELGQDDPIPMQVSGSFTPDKRVFGPTCGMDHRLFEADGHLKPDVRKYIMSSVQHILFASHDWSKWAIVYFAGSEASEWTSDTLEGNNDFDVLIGVDYQEFRRANPQYAHVSSQAITDLFNQGFRQFNGPVIITIDGKKFGPFDRTTYVNHDSYDIAKIKPYAAYNVSEDKWAVKPPHLPHWSLSELPRAVQQVLRSASNYAHHVLKLPEPERTQQGAALFDSWHSDRSRAFSDKGEGWWDIANLREKWLDQEGVWSEIVDCKHRANEGLDAAPVDWSNTPKFGAADHPYTQQDWYHGGHLPKDHSLRDQGLLHVGTQKAALDRIDPDEMAERGEDRIAHSARLYRLRLDPKATVCPKMHEDDWSDDDPMEHEEEGHQHQYDVHPYVNSDEDRGKTSLMGRGSAFHVVEDMGPHPRWQDPEVRRNYLPHEAKVGMGQAGPDYQGLHFKFWKNYSSQHDAPHWLDGNDKHDRRSFFGMMAFRPGEHESVGSLEFSPMHYGEGDREVHVHGIKVNPEHQRRGVGSALLKELERHYPDAPIHHGLRTQQGADLTEHVYGQPSPKSEHPGHSEQYGDAPYEGGWTLGGKPYKKTSSAATDALNEIGRKEHPNVNHYQSGGMGHLEGDESHSVVGFMPVHALKPYREHNGDWNGEHSAEVRERLGKDVDEGKGFHNPLMVEYNPDEKWGYLGEGNHRLRVADDKGLRTVPVRVVRSYGAVADRKKRGIGAPMELHGDFGPNYTPSDIHPHHFLKESKKATLVVEHRHWGGGLESLFPSDEDGPKPTAQTPWQAAGQRKDVHTYDKDLVARSITHPHEFSTEDVDPRDLRATQPKVVRAGVKHYMDNPDAKSDDPRLGNDTPRIYHREDGQKIILSGHHRAAAALLKGEKLKAIVIHGGWGGARNAA